jgi:hypothetical protein
VGQLGDPTFRIIGILRRGFDYDQLVHSQLVQSADVRRGTTPQ